VFEDKKLKIGDLGESRILESSSFLKGKMVGTPLFLSPEVLKEENYDHRVDIWALGCLMYHLTNLEPPFNSDGYHELKNQILYK